MKKKNKNLTTGFTISFIILLSLFILRGINNAHKTEESCNECEQEHKECMTNCKITYNCDNRTNPSECYEKVQNTCKITCDMEWNIVGCNEYCKQVYTTREEFIQKQRKK